MVARLVAVMLVLAASGAAAQTYDNILNGLTSVDLLIDNQLKDGCWPRPKETSQQIKLELARSIISVTKWSGTYLSLYALGAEERLKSTGKGTGICVFSWSLIIDDCVNIKTSFGKSTKFKCVTIWSRNGVRSLPKYEAQSDLNNNFVNAARQFLYDLEMDRLGKMKK